MLSPFDMCFTWAGIHARTRSMLNRLSALTVQMELLEEAAPPSGDLSFGQNLRASRAELAEASREARALVEAVGAQLPGAKVANLDEAISDTLAPLHRFLQRRETQLVGPTGKGHLEVAVEPELLRFAIAAVIDALLAPAVAGEELHVRADESVGKVILSFRLQTRRAPPERSAVEGQLTGVRSWLEMRGGCIDVSTTVDRVSVLLTMCPANEGERC